MAEKKKKKRLSLRRKEEEVEIEMEDGSIQTFVVKELLGPERDKFMNLMNTRMSIDAKGNPTGIKDVTGLQSSLLSMAVFGPNGKPFTQQEIDTWPAFTQTELFSIAQELSGLNKKAEGDAKNEPEANAVSG